MKKLTTIILVLLFSIQGFSQTKLKRTIIEADTLTVNYNAYVPFATKPTHAAQLQQVSSIVELGLDSIQDGYMPVYDSLQALLKSSPISVDSNGNVKVIGNLYTTGDMQAWTSTGTLPPTFWDALPIATDDHLGATQVGVANFDGTNFRVDANGLVTLVSGSGGGMVYPSAGIALSTGTAWGTSITNNSANWNTAFGWGNHSLVGYGLASALTTHAGLTTTAHGLGASAFHADSFFATGAEGDLATNAFPAASFTKTNVDALGINATQLGGILAVNNYHTLNANLSTVNWAAKTLFTNGAAGVLTEAIRFNRNGDVSRYNSIYSNAPAAAVSGVLDFRVHDGITGSSQTTVMSISTNGVDVSGALTAASLNATNLTTGKVPYDNGTSLVDSPIFATGATGNVLIGTTINNSKLTVSGGTTNQLAIFSDGTNPALMVSTNGFGIGGYIRIGDYDGVANQLFYEQNYQTNLHYFSGNVVATGEITAFSASDSTLKRNVKPIHNATSIINEIPSYTFNWNDEAVELNKTKDTTSLQYGTIAQQLQKTHPELVHKIYNDKLGVDYISIIPILVQAIQEADIRNNELEKRIEKLESLILK